MPGIALAIVEPWAVPIFRGHPRRAKRFAWAMLATAVACWALYCYWDFNVQTTAIHHALGRRSLVSALFGMALLAALIALQLGVGKIPRIIDNRWTNFMGERSYAFYLMHIAVILGVVSLLGADAGTPTLIAGMLLIGFPVTVALSALSWKYYESPFLERRLPWAPGLRPTAAPAHVVAADAPEPVDPQPAAATRA
jgi:peptidoglycan/LPS O-acetylase OafA/YrhL